MIKSWMRWTPQQVQALEPPGMAVAAFSFPSLAPFALPSGLQHAHNCQASRQHGRDGQS